MQTLQGIPGVQAMSIGSGQSKPVIRGLGFNRMVVNEDGVKHEGQQWGDDHGLEIDQFAVERVEVAKGPGALLYGSDAIGGVLNLYTNSLPLAALEGTVQLFGRTNNEQLGFSARVGGRKGRFYYRAHLTLTDYADYKVPTDSIQYHSYYIRLKDRRLRNTAGKEHDGSLLLGYTTGRLRTDLRISDSYSKSGFFANAHGIEVRLSQIDYDRSRRDIDLPYQWVNHLKIQSNTAWSRNGLALEGHIAYQNNRREENSEAVSHGYMPTPPDPLERSFDKSTYTAALRMRLNIGDRHELRAGISGEYQHNRRKGWGFIIPDFETAGFGLFATDRFRLNDHVTLNAGMRFDRSHTRIHAYRDWFRTPVGSDSVFQQRSAETRRDFNSLTWSAGIVYHHDEWLLKANAGKSFRVPIPKELGTDGVNYHIFRYERGNPNLDPEESYQLDASLLWDNDRLSLQFDPFLNYFPNYIYLNPTSQYVEGLQLYHYTQARVFRWGWETQVRWLISDRWEAEAKGEYLFARQRSGAKKGYSLPFSTPWTIDGGLKYAFTWRGEGFARISARIVGKQDEIVPPEKPTDGHWTLHASFGKTFPLSETSSLKISLRADNLLNARYYDHTSYYRLIDVPEPGRNFSATIGWVF